MIEACDLVKQYRQGPRAVDGVSFRVARGETLCLIGTSGCGKTTTLKMLNRLIEPTAGRILIDGQNVLEQDVIRLRRKIGYVIQKGGLFPHLTVGENIGLLPKLEQWPVPRIRARVEELLEKVNLPPAQFQHRYPAELSGGQQQRVGVARALALNPPIILLDEPFGALDPITREQIQDEFLALKDTLQVTSVMVTHDLPEAFKLGDQIALMHQGRLLQCGTMLELLDQPADEFVATFLKRHTGLQQLDSMPVRKLMKAGVPVLRQPAAPFPPDELAAYAPTELFVLDQEGQVRGWLDKSRLDTADWDVFLQPVGVILPLQASLKEALEAFLKTPLSALPVQGEGQQFKGIIERSELQKLL